MPRRSNDGRVSLARPDAADLRLVDAIPSREFSMSEVACPNRAHIGGGQLGLRIARTSSDRAVALPISGILTARANHDVPPVHTCRGISPPDPQHAFIPVVRRNGSSKPCQPLSVFSDGSRQHKGDYAP